MPSRESGESVPSDDRHPSFQELLRHALGVEASYHLLQQDYKELLALAEYYKQQAREDVLSGLANRRALEEKFEEFSESGVEFGAALFDVNKFKQVNNTLGHRAGDELIQAIGSRIATRESDLPVFNARSGGDEFVILFRLYRNSEKSIDIGEEHRHTESPQLQAEGLVNRFKAIFMGAIEEKGYDKLGVGISAGYSIAKPEDTLDTLLERADAAMYREKRTQAEDN